MRSIILKLCASFVPFQVEYSSITPEKYFFFCFYCIYNLIFILLNVIVKEIFYVDGNITYQHESTKLYLKRVFLSTTLNLRRQH